MDTLILIYSFSFSTYLTSPRIAIDPNSYLWLQPGDLLIQRSNTLAYVGTCAIYDQAPGKYIYPDLIMRIRVSKELDLRYIYFVITSNASKKYFQENASGTSGTMPKIN